MKTLSAICCLSVALFVPEFNYSTLQQKKESNESCSTCGHPISPDELGNIKGRVVNSKGAGVADVTVFSDPIDRDIITLPSVMTDRKGQFIFEGLRKGRYKLYAGKESLGYPESDSRFFGDIRPTVIIELKGRETIANISLKMPKRVARLSGKVVDASTNTPIRWAEIKMSRADTPERRQSFRADGRGRFARLIPLDTVIIEALPGEGNKYKSGQLQVSAVKQGERKNVIIKLEPVK